MKPDPCWHELMPISSAIILGLTEEWWWQQWIIAHTLGPDDFPPRRERESEELMGYGAIGGME